jgi:hypothetical protein
MPDKISMISLLVCLGLIYFTAIFFWLRYLCLRSFSTTERRGYFIRRLLDMILYIPIGLQAAFLFCYALFHLPVIGNKLSGLFEMVVLDNKANHYPDFYPLQIIFIASLLLAVNYILQRMAAAHSDKITAGLLQFFIFMASLFLLRTLVQNIYESIGWSGAGHILIGYNNYYGWFLVIVITLVFSVFGGGMPKTDANTKYMALASRLLWLYCFITLLFGLPRIIYLVTERLN